MWVNFNPSVPFICSDSSRRRRSSPEPEPEPEIEMDKEKHSGATSQSNQYEYEDLLPVMAEKLDVDSFVAELCGGFRLLADPTTGLITNASLHKNCAFLGMEEMSPEDAQAMVKEGDLDGDGALNETEFCILMVRLSPGMMQDAETWLEKAISRELPRQVSASNCK